MAKYNEGDIVRSKWGWVATVAKYEDGKLWLYDEETKLKDAVPYDEGKGLFVVVKSHYVSGAAELSAFESPTLLDQFAMAALTGLLGDTATTQEIEGDDPFAFFADSAYQYAQAMMKAREAQK